MNIGPGSYLEVTMPWVVGSNGYTTKVTGQLLHLEASTSLQVSLITYCFCSFMETKTVFLIGIVLFSSIEVLLKVRLWNSLSELLFR